MVTCHMAVIRGEIYLSVTLVSVIIGTLNLILWIKVLPPGLTVAYEFSHENGYRSLFWLLTDNLHCKTL